MPKDKKRQAILEQARQRAIERANLIRWIPENEGEELLGIFQGTESYNSKQYGDLLFYKFAFLDGSGSFKQNDQSYTPEEGEIIELPAQGHLRWYFTEQFDPELQLGEAVYLRYTGKTPSDKSAQGYVHGYTAERIPLEALGFGDGEEDEPENVKASE